MTLRNRCLKATEKSFLEVVKGIEGTWHIHFNNPYKHDTHIGQWWRKHGVSWKMGFSSKEDAQKSVYEIMILTDFWKGLQWMQQETNENL